MKVRFEDKVLDPSTGEVSRVDTATLLFPISALANDPDAPAPASAPEVPAPAAEAPAPEPAAPAPAPMLFDDSQLEAESAEPAVLGGTAGLGPAFTRGEIEPPAGEKTVGDATIGVYTAEQQSRLGVDEEGKKVDDAAAIGPSEAPSLDQDIDRI